ncbi:threonine dehydratase [Haloechinothrix alba]|uniref:Threonine dehydratase n=1 Tax=Haloechinothrix alba TaxID=664784 RepID=A0A238X0X4_9PSEU|nr:pyridoxal-phosphate dependent enzyme [Haloechinothrix alba]SNR52615.1 threonine dehydratase [Haloechinothrix alba]
MIADLDLAPEHIEHAARTLDPVLRDSPQFVDEQLCEALGRQVLVKLETANPLHSFKGRGAWTLMREWEGAHTVVCASAGNFGQAMAYAGRAFGVPVSIFVGRRVDPVKVARMRGLGADVTVVDGDSSRAAATYAAESPERSLVRDGEHPRIAEGAGTIGLELGTAAAFDSVVVPVGDGALISGVGMWLKTHLPGVHVIGVCAAGSPAMAHAWRTGRVTTDGATDTVATTLCNPAPIPESVERVRALVDDIVLVDDAALRSAQRLAAETLGVLLEPAGAAGIAALATHELPGRRCATVLTGGDSGAAWLGERYADGTP